MPSAERPRPDVIAFDVRGGQSWSDDSLQADEVVCVLEEAADMHIPAVVFEASAYTPLRDLTRFSSYAAIRLLHVTILFPNTETLLKADAAQLRDCGAAEVGLPVNEFPETRDARRGIESFRDHGLGIRIQLDATPGHARSLPSVVHRMAAVGATRLQLDLVARGLPHEFTATQLERLGNAVLGAAREARLRLLVIELPLVRRLEIEGAWGEAMLPGEAPAERSLELVDSRGTLYVDRSGKVFPSPVLPIPVGDVRRQQLAGVWLTSPVLDRLRDRSSLTGCCGRCEFRDNCGGSRVRAWRATGDIAAQDPGCAFAEAKAKRVRQQPRSPRRRLFPGEASRPGV